MFLELSKYKEHPSDFLNCSDCLVLSEQIFFSLKKKYIELWTDKTQKISGYSVTWRGVGELQVTSGLYWKSHFGFNNRTDILILAFKKCGFPHTKHLSWITADLTNLSYCAPRGRFLKPVVTTDYMKQLAKQNEEPVHWHLMN